MVRVGERYRHFKGELYEVICVARDSDNLEDVVVYRGFYDSKEFGKNPIWTRSVSDFCGEKVFSDGTRIKRFEKVGGGSVGVRVKKMRPNAIIPNYAHPGDAAMDLFSAEEGIVPAGQRRLVFTGIAMELPEGYFASIRGKSGLAYKKGISILGGVIEHGYRGEYGVIVLNTGNEDFEIKIGDKIAQVVIAPVATAEIEEVEELSDTTRGEDGFGSTGGSNI